jgi:hypothetical protein
VRILRRIAIAIVAVLALLLIASAIIEPVAESRLRAVARRKTDAKAPPVVEIGAFPILLRLAQGRIPHLRIDARDVLHDKIRVERLEVDLRDIRFSPRRWLSGGRIVFVGNGRLVARVTQDALNAYLAEMKVGATTTLREGSALVRTRARIAGAARQIDAVGTVAVVRGQLVFTASSATVDGHPPPPELAAEARRKASFSVALPPLPGGVVISRVETHAGFGVLVATVKNWTHDAGT